ncbi:MAG: Mur ligase family protein [Steroidobacteraceae bacterium]
MTRRHLDDPAPRGPKFAPGGGGLPLAQLTAGVLDPPADIRVTGVTLDSRAVEPGGLFLACRGARHHGLAFADRAIAAGARAILYEPESASEALPAARAAASGGVVFMAEVPRLAQQAGEIASRFFGAPSEHLCVAGITGTNGKTTSAYLLAQALTRAGRRAGYLGTLGAGLAPAPAPGGLPGGRDPILPGAPGSQLAGAMESFGLTTADAVTVQRQLAALRALGAECVAMEVSSHALAQGRVNGVRFRAAAFTNLTRDHLDFHGSMEAYGAAKARLFERELAARVINADDAFGLELARRVASAAGRLVLTTRCSADPRVSPPGDGERPRAGRPFAGAELVRARDVEFRSTGTDLTIECGSDRARLSVRLIGEFNVENVLTVAGVLLALELPLARVAAVLGECAAPPGRMEIVAADGPLVIVDYAHTPDGLANALIACRAHCRGTLRVVFGCGGDRDAGKRPLMGRTARDRADELIVTDDNPRTEDPERIVADILAGVGADAPVRVEHDRAAAIRGALERSAPSDTVLIAGKGHEDYQIVGAERRAFSDQAVASAFFQGSRSHGSRNQDPQGRGSKGPA